MFAWTKPPMLPTTTASDRRLHRPGRTRRQGATCWRPIRTTRDGRALIAFGSDVMFGGPDVGVRRRLQRARAHPHVPVRPLRLEPAGAGARRHPWQRDRAHPAQLRLLHRAASCIRWADGCSRSVGRRMQRAWLDFSAQGWETGEIRWSSGQDWPIYDTDRSLHPHHPVRPRQGGLRSRRRAPQGLGRPVLARNRVALVGVVAQVVQELLEHPGPSAGDRATFRSAPQHRWASSPSPTSDGSRPLSARRGSPRRTPRYFWLRLR